MFRRTVLILVVALMMPSIAAAADPDVESVRKAFLDRLSSVNLDRRARAAIDLGADDPWKLPLLYRVLEDDHWFVRFAGAKAIAAATNESIRASLRADLLAHERWNVREGIAVAMGIRPVDGDAGALVGALEDDSWQVRRGAARSLGEIVSREGIVALIERLDRAEKARVRIWAAWSLRLITGQRTMGADRDAWRKWWKLHEKDPGWGPLRGDAEVERRELGGIRLETVTIARDPKNAARLPDLLVLAPHGYRNEYARPYLDEISARMRVTYVQLPSLKELTGRTGFDGEGIPRYPVDKLVRALDRLRKALGKPRISILAHGATGWMALKYAQVFPKRVDGLILIDAWLDAPSYVRSLMSTLSRGDLEEKWVARILTNQNRRPKDRVVYAAIARVTLTKKFRSRDDLGAAFIWSTSWDPQGFSIVPDVKVTRRTKIKAPMLFYFPLQNAMSGHHDAVKIREVFPNAIAAVLREGHGLPYIDDPDEFLRIFDAFLARNGIGAADGGRR